MVDPSDVVILVLSTKDASYDPFKDACRRTWMEKARRLEFKCFFYEGAGDTEYINGDTVVLTAPDDLSGTSLKLVEALKYINGEIDFKYIFRTNLSSYIYPEILLSFINKNENPDLYSGVVGHYVSYLDILNRFAFTKGLASRYLSFLEFSFASGSGFWLSKKNVQKLISMKRLNFDYIDDVMVGDFFNKTGVNVSPALRVELSNGNIICPDDYLSKEFRENCYHVRLKSRDRNIDVALFYDLNNFDFFNVDVMGLR